jgi:hypothetical protein
MSPLYRPLKSRYIASSVFGRPADIVKNFMPFRDFYAILCSLFRPPQPRRDLATALFRKDHARQVTARG